MFDSDRYLVVALVVLGLFLVAVMSPAPEERRDWQTREISCSSGDVLSGSLVYLQDLGYSIETVSYENGFVATRYAGQVQLAGVGGLLESVLIGERQFAVTVLARPINANRSDVRVSLIAESWQEGSLFSTGHWTENPFYYNRDDYDEFFIGLEKELGSPCMDVEQEAATPSLVTPVPSTSQSAASDEMLLELSMIGDSYAYGDSVLVRVMTIPGATCSIALYHAIGGIAELDLPDARANEEGKVFWMWRVGNDTPLGMAQVVVSATLDGEEKSASLPFDIRE